MSANPIKKIEAIKNVRNFLDFSASDDLDRKNVIYAPNGIGKTNLSRFLEYVSDKNLDLQSLKSLEAGISPIEFKVSFEDQTSINHNNYTSSDLGRILVYNSDYIEKNIRTNDFSNKEIDGQLEVELGEEQAKLTDLENQLETKNNELDNQKKSIEALLVTKTNEIKEWDPRGRLITAELVYENLNDQKYSECLSNKDDRKIGEINQEGWVNAKENFDQIKDLDPDQDKITINFNEVKVERLSLNWIEKALTESIDFEEPPTGELKQHIEKITNDWIKAGLKIHEEDKDNCPFCLQGLEEEGRSVIEKYKAHVESEKAKFEENVDLELGNITSFVKDLANLNNSIKVVFDIRTKNLNLSLTWSDIDSGSLTAKLNDLKSKLSQKRRNPEKKIFYADEKLTEEQKLISTSAHFSEIKELIQEINSGVISNKRGVEQINRQLTSIGHRQTDLRKLIGQKYLVEFYDANKVSVDNRNTILASIQSISEDIKETKKTLPTKEVSTKIVDLFNTYIKQIGITKYQASIESNKIILKLDETYDISGDTKNLLSEGEKNAIALSYFLASTIRRLPSSEKYSAGIFVIDDPVCSVGYKYFYGICDVLKTFHKTAQIEALSGNESSRCPQLIILTHNIQFYNMLVSNIFKKGAHYFELERENKKHQLKKVNDHKLSEYKTALRRVKRYAEGTNIDENVGNDIRRVLETICNFHGFKELNQDNITSVLTTMSGSLLSFAHDSSHEDSNNYEDPFDSSQYKEMATELIRLINGYSPEVLKDL